MSRSRISIASILLAVLFASAACSDSKKTVGPDVTVGGVGADFASVQAAVDASPPGTRIEISGGVFQEQVIVDKRLVIAGVGAGTTLRMQGAKQAFPDDSSDDSSAVLVIRNASGVVIENLAVSGPQDGISIRDSSNVALRGVVAADNGDDGIDVRGSSDVSISGTVTGNGDKGVLVRDGSDGIDVTASTVSDNQDRGVRIRDSSGGGVHNSTVMRNGDDGIQIRDSSGFEIRGCTVMDNAGYGIRITNAADTALGNNTLSGNTEGDVRQE